MDEREIEAEYFDSEIEICGKVPKSKIKGLIQAINCQECSDEWDGAVVTLGDPEEEFAKAIEQLLSLKREDHHGTIWLCNNYARWGELAEIEEYCVENDIGFRRRSSSYGEYNPEIKEFRSGMESYEVYAIDADGYPVIDASVVIDYIKAIEAPGNNTPTEQQTKESLEAYETMKGALPLNVAPLEPFEIIEELES